MSRRDYCPAAPRTPTTLLPGISVANASIVFFAQSRAKSNRRPDCMQHNSRKTESMTVRSM